MSDGGRNPDGSLVCLSAGFQNKSMLTNGCCVDRAGRGGLQSKHVNVELFEKF